LLIIIWEFLGKNSTLLRLLVATPSLIIEYFYDNQANLLQGTAITFLESFIGLIIATSIAFTLVTIGVFIPKFMNWILPLSISSQVIPLITLAPLFIIVFGYGYLSKMMMAALICFFPIFINFNNGLKSIKQEFIDLANIYDASIFKKYTRIYFPLSLPYIFTGLKVSATLSIIGAIVAEFNGTNIGLGKNLFLAAKRLEPELMMNSLFLSAILGGISYLLIVLLEKYFGKWYTKKGSQ
jgi:ABC-type nitrate/sulfonate/bicarbonate transport system permease component